ncbi:MAG: hypothetical protein OXE17_00185 [Chloroflexi bacterium]|nr:hypothetical protein [Chloroflexota bacterium]
MRRRYVGPQLKEFACPCECGRRATVPAGEPLMCLRCYNSEHREGWEAEP